VIGDATKKLRDETKEKFPYIPWKEFAGMRDVVVHQYFRVDIEIVWNTATIDIPKIKSEVEKILSSTLSETE
jgi:uncharacterized protein with HEPN domain